MPAAKAAAKPKKETQRTAYVVLVQDPVIAGAYKRVHDGEDTLTLFEAPSDIVAVRLAHAVHVKNGGDSAATLVAVPARSFRPRDVKVQTTSRTVVA